MRQEIAAVEVLARETKTKKWLIIGTLLVALSFCALAVGYFLKGEPGAVVNRTQHWGGFLWEVGKIGLSGGLVAAFMKMFYSLNFLEVALENFMWTDKYLAKRNDTKDLWLRLSTFLYLRNQGDNSSKDEVFLARLRIALNHKMRNERNHFMRGLHRSIYIDWLDEVAGIITVTESQTFEVIAATDAEILLESRVRTFGSIPIEEYNIAEDEVILEDPVGKPLVPRRRQDREYWITEYTLCGSTSYKIRRNRRVSWSIFRDPILSLSATNIYDGLRLEVSCGRSNIKTIFREAPGTAPLKNLMDKKQMELRPGNQHRLLEGVWLPGDGCSLYIEKI